MFRIILFLSSIFFLTSCASTQMDNGNIIPEDKIIKKTIKVSDILLEEHKLNVGLLVPLNKNKKIGDSLIKAAQLAISDSKYSSVNLNILNSELLETDYHLLLSKIQEQSIKIIIGPVYGSETEKLLALLNNENITVLSLSNDSSIKSKNLLIMGVSPESQAAAIVNYAINSGVKKINLIIPENKYGKLVDLAVEEAVLKVSNITHSVSWYNNSNFQEVVDKRLSELENNDNEAIFMPQGGNNLAALNNSLEKYKLNKVVLLGLQSWQNSSILEMKSLNNAIILRKNLSEEQFYDNFSRTFNMVANNIDFITYNSLIMLINMHRNQVYISKPSIIENNNGASRYSEVSFDEDGLSNYKFSISKLQNGEFVLLEE